MSDMEALLNFLTPKKAELPEGYRPYCTLCGEDKPLCHVAIGKGLGYNPDVGRMYRGKFSWNYCHDCYLKIRENQKINEEREEILTRNNVGDFE